MTESTQRVAIETHFDTLWADTVPVKWDNTEWKDPADGSSWVALTIVSDNGTVVTLNNPALYRFDGEVTVQIFTQEGTGTGQADTLAGQIMGIFRHRILALPDPEGNVHFLVPTKRNIGVKNGWLETKVVAPFWRIESLVKPPLP